MINAKGKRVFIRMRNRRASEERGDELTIDMLKEVLRKEGESPDARFHDSMPFIGYVPGNGSEIAGRFFPSRNAILVLTHNEDEVTRATVNHELAHAISYKSRCGGTGPSERSQCGYHGQHDQKFYEILEDLHRQSGISVDAARAVEGAYDYPKHWRDQEEWGASAPAA